MIWIIAFGKMRNIAQVRKIQSLDRFLGAVSADRALEGIEQGVDISCSIVGKIRVFLSTVKQWLAPTNPRIFERDSGSADPRAVDPRHAPVSLRCSRVQVRQADHPSRPKP